MNNFCNLEDMFSNTISSFISQRTLDNTNSENDFASTTINTELINVGPTVATVVPEKNITVAMQDMQTQIDELQFQLKTISETINCSLFFELVEIKELIGEIYQKIEMLDNITQNLLGAETTKKKSDLENFDTNWAKKEIKLYEIDF